LEIQITGLPSRRFKRQHAYDPRLNTSSEAAPSIVELSNGVAIPLQRSNIDIAGRMPDLTRTDSISSKVINSEPASDCTVPLCRSTKLRAAH
jgi:hypothetical protein